MKSTIFDIDKFLIKGIIESEYELEQSLNADKQLRLLIKDNPVLKKKRIKLRRLISEYESQNWTLESNISETRIEDSNQAEILVEQERIFIQKRKILIKLKIKKLNINQQELGKILGHNSKTYMSELMNGVSPFTLKDLIVISRLLEINLNKLVFTNISYPERKKIARTIRQLKKPKLKLDIEEFVFG